jgi:16S rRNA C967 or C1407 C5-methylase (RsmB/RsmF family)/NOL1/NOP2/fmu family ribosome biogenesis protein
MSSLAFPIEFEKRMHKQLGAEWPAFAKAHSEPAPVSIRVNPYKSTGALSLTGKTTPIQWSKYGYYLDSRPVFTLDPLFHAGCYYVQEASSMLLEQAIKSVVDNATAIRALDLCAAPGGKSTHLLSLLPTDSLLVSNEVIRSRATILAENMCKWGHSNVMVTNNDPEDFRRLEGFFDLIVVDAPCSGEGLFRKDPDSCKEWSADNAKLCSLRQQRILRDVWPSLKEGGVLIYSTCTYNAEENAENIRKFSTENTCEAIPLTLHPSWGVHLLDFGYQCLPSHVAGEGFYLCMLRKKESQTSVSLRRTKKIFAKPPRLAANYENWVAGLSPVFVQFHDYLLMIPENLFHEMEFISTQLKVISTGTTIGTLKNTKLVPDHALAMSVHLAKEAFQVIPVSKEEALLYFRKESFWRESVEKGYTLIEYSGQPLGFVNVLDSRMNNLYPADWRIRMAPAKPGPN